MTRFGYDVKKNCKKEDLNESKEIFFKSQHNKINDIEIKSVILRKPQKLNPLKLLNEVKKEAIDRYEFERLNLKFKNTSNDICISKNENINKFVETKEPIENMEEFSNFRKDTYQKLQTFVDKVNSIPLELNTLFTYKSKVDLLYYEYLKQIKIICLDFIQIEFILMRLPNEVSDILFSKHENFSNFTKNLFDPTQNVTIDNLYKLFKIRNYLHCIFTDIISIIKEIGDECLKCHQKQLAQHNLNNSESKNDIVKLNDTDSVESFSFNNLKNVVLDDLTNKTDKNDEIGEINNIVEINKNKEINIIEINKNIENNKNIEINEINKNNDVDYNVPDLNFSYQFDQNTIKNLFENMVDEKSKAYFMEKYEGTSRQVLHREIMVEINRLGGFGLHLKTIQPILTRLFCKPEELDPKSRPLNIFNDWGAFQFYCETLIDAVKKLFYTSIPDRDIVTPVLSHYIASLSINNPYFRLYVQNFILEISDLNLLDLNEIEYLLDNVYHFMAYLYLTPSGVGLGGTTKRTCFGLRNAWYILAKVINSKSLYIDIKIIITYRFLQICGFAMLVFYQNQFVKLLNYLIMNCIPEWKKNLPNVAYPYFVRLYDFLVHTSMKGTFERPKYLNKFIFSSLNKTNIPKFNDKELFCIKNFRLLY